MIQNLIFEIFFSFLKILLRAYSVFLFVQTFQLTSPDVPIDIFFFLISDFLAESLKANKN